MEWFGKISGLYYFIGIGGYGLLNLYVYGGERGWRDWVIVIIVLLYVFFRFYWFFCLMLLIERDEMLFIFNGVEVVMF